MSIDLEKLLALAKDASLGNWKADRNCGVSVGNVQIAATVLHTDAAFIAAANPAVVTELANTLISKQVSQAALDVLAERQRQMDVEGWTPAHDDCHYSNELVAAAACYSSHVVAREWVYRDRPENYREEPVPDDWPVNWDDEWWKPTNPRRDLVKAAALLLAEIERIDRAAAVGN
jgi:hypothetical protein